MRVELFDVKGDALQPLSATTTGAYGRADLVSGRPLVVGQYELCFQVAGCSCRQGIAVGDPPYLDHMPIRFHLSRKLIPAVLDRSRRFGDFLDGVAA